MRRRYAEGGITAAHCRQSTNFSNGPRMLQNVTLLYLQGVILGGGIGGKTQ